jgi:large subunit ribosomal protein L30
LSPTSRGEGKGKTSRSAETGARTITIEQVRSGICCKERHRRVLRALGLRHPHHRVIRPDNAAVRGMVDTISYLVRIVED